MKILLLFFTLIFGFALFSTKAAVNDSIIFKNATKPISFHLNTGSSFMSSFKNVESGVNTYIAPQFSYSFTKKFIFDAGFAIVNSNLKVKKFTHNEFNDIAFTANYTSTYIYFGGRYLLNDHITISGHTYSQINAITNSSYSEKQHNFNIKGAHLGIDYQLNENSSIGIHINYSNDHIILNSNPYFFQNSILNK